MFVPTLFTSAVAVSVALGVPQRSPPEQSLWIAVVTSDGDIQVSRNGGAPAMLVARCPVLPMPVEPDSAHPIPDPGQDGAGDEPDPTEDPFLDLSSPSASSLGLDIGDIGDTGEAQHLARPARSACGSPQSPAQIAWSPDALYVACAAGPLYRWREDTGAWPVQLASPGAADAGLPALTHAVPDRIVAMLGGTELRLVDASQRLWALKQHGENHALRQIGTVPEPVAALAEWRGVLVAAGATALWRRSGPDESWEPLVTIAACALSANRDSLWLAGPAGLVELSGQRLRVHALAPLTGIALRAGDIWLASGRGPLVRTSLAAAATAMLAGALRLTPESDSTGVPADLLRSLRTRARRARWLPDVAAQARWSRSRNNPTAAASWPDTPTGSHVGALALFVWLTWRLDPDDPAATATARSWP